MISIKGCECKLEILSKLALETGGDINLVTAEDLSKNFEFIVEDEVIATKAKL